MGSKTKHVSRQYTLVVIFANVVAEEIARTGVIHEHKTNIKDTRTLKTKSNTYDHYNSAGVSSVHS